MKQKYKINSTRKIDGKMNLSIELHYVLELTFSVYIDNCPLVNSAAPPPKFYILATCLRRPYQRLDTIKM